MGLESVELVMAWEEHFDIEIPVEIAATLETPRLVIDAIEQILRRDHPEGPHWAREKIEYDVCEIVAEQLGIKRSSFTLDSLFIRDLGVD
jgi:acyl carrier protein